MLFLSSLWIYLRNKLWELPLAYPTEEVAFLQLCRCGQAAQHQQWNVSFIALIEILYKNVITFSYIHSWSTTHSLRPCNANMLAYAKKLFPSNFLLIVSKIKIYPKRLLHLVTFMIDYTLTETMQCKYNSLCQKAFSF